MGTPQFPFPLGGGRTRRTPRAPLFPSHSGQSSDRWSSDPGGGCPARLTQARETNLRGVAAHSCGPMGRNGADYGDRPLTPPFVPAASPLQPTRAQVSGDARVSPARPQLTVTSFVMLIDEQHTQARVLVALLISILFLSLEIWVQPFRRIEDNWLAHISNSRSSSRT